MAHHRVGGLLIASGTFSGLVDAWLFAIVQHIPFWHGLYCIWMTAITVGGDVNPRGLGYLCLALAPAPLVAIALGFFTSALAAVNVKDSEKRIMKHVTAEHEATREAAC